MGNLEGEGFGGGRVLLWSRPEQQLFIGESPAVQAEVIPGTSSALIADVCRSVFISAAATFLSRVGKSFWTRPLSIGSYSVHQGQIF